MSGFIEEILPKIKDGGSLRLYSGLTPLYRNGGEASKIFDYGKPDRFELMLALMDFVGVETWIPAVTENVSRRTRIDPNDLVMLSESADLDFDVERDGVQYKVRIMGSKYRLRAFVSLKVETDHDPEPTEAYLLTASERDAVCTLIRRLLIEPVETVTFPDDEGQVPFLRGLTVSQRRLLLRADPEGDKHLRGALKALENQE